MHILHCISINNVSIGIEIGRHWIVSMCFNQISSEMKISERAHLCCCAILMAHFVRSILTCWHRPVFVSLCPLVMLLFSNYHNYQPHLWCQHLCQVCLYQCLLLPWLFLHSVLHSAPPYSMWSKILVSQSQPDFLFTFQCKIVVKFLRMSIYRQKTTVLLNDM